MPKKPLTPEVAERLAALATNEQLLSLHIDKYKSGQYKGEHYADYKEGDRVLPLDSVNVLKSIETLVASRDSGMYDILLALPINDRLFVAMKTKGGAPNEQFV